MLRQAILDFYKNNPGCYVRWQIWRVVQEHPGATLNTVYFALKTLVAEGYLARAIVSCEAYYCTPGLEGQAEGLSQRPSYLARRAVEAKLPALRPATASQLLQQLPGVEARHLRVALRRLRQEGRVKSLRDKNQVCYYWVEAEVS